MTRQEAEIIIANVVRGFHTKAPGNALSDADSIALTATLFLACRERGILKEPVSSSAWSEWENCVRRAWRDHPRKVADNTFAEGWLDYLKDLTSLH